MKIENSLRSLHSLSRAFLQLVPVRLFGTGRQPTYMKRRREGGVTCLVLALSKAVEEGHKWKQPMLWSFS
ncbi:unnamed protein product [Prunus armeniaca]|uniref:Uncharacterized protein n=1 Tax=Prunus armeniaca TaxID=36596 RepID=A0A6J5WR62_PRUAR|nr:unnamed protein product [Prunus armeniaca]CAB4286197.1 unnamed protein product [Prunus armeniaca]CAB4302803.1 unnamed protein product [Prunus armeniaca]